MNTDAQTLEIQAEYTISELKIVQRKVQLLIELADARQAESANVDSIVSELESLSESFCPSAKVSDEKQPSPLRHLVKTFSLSELEIDILLICFAPEVHPEVWEQYGALGAGENRRAVTFQLLRNLLNVSLNEESRLRDALSVDGILFRAGILVSRPENAIDAGVISRQPILISDRFTKYLLGSQRPDPALYGFVELVSGTDSEEATPNLAADQVAAIADHLKSTNHQQIVYIHGPEGAGHSEVVASIAQSWGRPLLRMNLRKLQRQAESAVDAYVEAIIREACLLNAALYISNIEAFLEPGASTVREAIIENVSRVPALFLSGSEPIDLKILSEKGHAIQVELNAPNESSRVEIWSEKLNGAAGHEGGPRPDEFAARYRFTSGQIQTAVNFATMESISQGRGGRIQREDLIVGCRMSSNRKLTELAKRIESRFLWEDLVLSDSVKEQVRGVVRSYRKQHAFYEGWGFGRRFQYGRGVSALFGGASGTGKTMAASVIAGELDLELYKIDLSRVISKYIGETEKNLSKLFKEAETSNAILFFDEADALFGKRSEVKDAHDRHANIEIDYLLQQMEEYEGLTILATNLSQNIDDAFTRRLQFIVNFSKPRAEERLRIWQGMFPPEAEVAADVDFELLAANVELPGGSIKNIVFNAGMAALDEGRAIHMEHLVRAVKTEYLKENMPFIAANFGVQASR